MTPEEAYEAWWGNQFVLVTHEDTGESYPAAIIGLDFIVDQRVYMAHVQGTLRDEVWVEVGVLRAVSFQENRRLAARHEPLGPSKGLDIVRRPRKMRI